MKWTLIKLLIPILIMSKTYSGLYLQHSFNYQSDTDNAETLTYTAMRNITFMGAGFGKGEKWIVGQSIMLWNKAYNNTSMTSESTIDLLELGPRFQYFLNGGRNFYISAVYNFYVKGTRDLAGASQDIDGTSYLLTTGLQFKISRLSYLGFSLNYHSIAITESTVGTTNSEVNHSYTSIFPAIELSLRFR